MVCGRRSGVGGVHKLAKLAEAFEEGDHPGVDAAVENYPAHGEVAGGEEVEGGDFRLGFPSR